VSPPIRVLTLNPVSAEALARLEPGVFEVGDAVTDPDVVLVRSADLWSVDLPPSVLAVGRAGTGVDTIPVDALGRQGIPVFNAPGSNANAVKELVVAAAVMAARRIAPAWRFVEGLSGDDASIRAQVEAGKRRFLGFELKGAAVAVIGLGAVGVEVANAFHSLGSRVTGFDPAPSAEHAGRLAPGVARALDVDEAVRSADVVTVHVPLAPATRGLVSTPQIAAIAEGGVVLNFAREEIVDDAAVIAGLESGHLSGYVSDFPTSALIGHPGVTALPHLGASTVQSQEVAVATVLETVRRFVVEGTIRHSVNFPEVGAPRPAGDRLCVATIGSSGEIGPTLTAAGVAVAGVAEARRGEVGYVIVDLKSGAGDAAAAAARSIDGVTAVRVIPFSRG
jgi:D-3-phosphoglycerate dehydrogenase